MAKTIVVGVDESEVSRCALDWSIQFARDLEGGVRAVHVASDAVMLPGSAFQFDMDRHLDDVRQLLNGPWTKALQDADVPHETELVQGDPADELLRIADALAAYVVVIGARKRPQLDKLGSTALRLVHRAIRPVALVPPVIGSERELR
jgi:nucleotide-binding universal stress UspA family protein